MKKLLLLMAALLTISGGAAHAQDLTGAWQGTPLAQSKRTLRALEFPAFSSPSFL